MPQDDEHGEFRWPADDSDGGQGAGPQDRLSEQPTVWVPVPGSGVARTEAPQHGDYPQGPEAMHAQPRRIEPHGQAQQEASGAPEPASADEPDSSDQVRQTPRSEPRGRRRGLLITGVLLVVVAVAVVLALPPVSNRLMLPWAPNAPKAQPPEPAAITRTLHGPRVERQNGPTREGVAAALGAAAQNPALGSLTGSVIDPATGKTLWARDGAKPRTPASTAKLLTTAAALLAFDGEMRIPTTVVAGREPGTVVLVAGGDPTLSALPKGEKSVYPNAAHLDALVAEVKRATGGNVDKVALDLTAYSGPTTAPGWDPVDVPKYTAATVPAMLDGGRTDPKSNHSERVDNPAGALAQRFADRLGADVAERSTVTAPNGAEVLGRVQSAPLTSLVRRCLLLSDNVLADGLARQIAMKTGSEPSFAGGAEATLAVLSKHGFDVGGVRLVDGSGLSELNKAPAALLAELLAVAAAPTTDDPRTAELRPLLAALPVAGGTGTLAQRYGEPPATGGRGWVRAKTGTLSEVNTLAGLVLDSEGRVLVFAFMSSGPDPATARPALDTLAAALR